MTTDIDPLALIAYESGITPLDYAEGCVLISIGASEMLGASRDVAARRVIAALLDAGWQMPVWPVPEPCQEAS